MTTAVWPHKASLLSYNTLFRDVVDQLDSRAHLDLKGNKENLDHLELLAVVAYLEIMVVLDQVETLVVMADLVPLEQRER